MKRLIILFLFHLLVIFSNALYFFVESLQQDDLEKKPIPVLNNLKSIYNLPLFEQYVVLSGAGSGYGFYGRNVGTNKFFMVEHYSSEGELIEKFDPRTEFRTKNGFVRFITICAKLYTFNTDTQELESKAIENPLRKVSRLSGTLINQGYKI